MSLSKFMKANLPISRVREVKLRAGATRMNADGVREVRILYLAIIRDLVHGATTLAVYRGRKTIKPRDVVRAVQARGKGVYLDSE